MDGPEDRGSGWPAPVWSENSTEAGHRVFSQMREHGIAWTLRSERPPPSEPNARWSMEFMSDGLVDGRALRLLDVVDNGPELAGRVLDAWCLEHGIELSFIRPGEPRENAYAESFNGRVREECLNQHAFEFVSHARSVIDAWREDDSTIRPHSSLGGIAPEDVPSRRAEAHAPQPSARAAHVEARLSPDNIPFPYP